MASGFGALASNTAGNFNTALGRTALHSNTTGVANVAVGADALASNMANGNCVAVGTSALANSDAGPNTALGTNAGVNLTTGAFNIDIANEGVAGEANTIRIGDVQTATYIAGISGIPVVGDAVVVDANGQLGTVASSVRFKKEVRPMDKTSEAILALKPVSFQYKSDSKRTPQFGLIAEEVAKVSPDLVVHDRKGEIYSVRYEAVNAMLLNEFLKEHRTVQEQQATIIELKSAVAQQQKESQSIAAQQQKEIRALAATVREQASQIERVSAQLELQQAPAQTVVNQ